MYEPEKKKSVSDVVFDQLRDQIVSGVLLPGEALPGERQLCEMLEVNRGAVREALLGQAATKIHPMALEVNVLLDADDGRLQRSGSILRLRNYGEQHIVTFKGPVSYHGKIKERPEYEVSCDDTTRMSELFKHLG